MAKKVTIEGLNKLVTTADDWGGVNNTDESIEKYGTTVPSGAEWGMNREEIERFIKQQLNFKFGDLRTTEADENNHIHLLCFATEADATEYDDTHDSSLVIKDLVIPINVTQSDAYISSIATETDTTKNYIVADGDDFDVYVQFKAILYRSATGERENYGGNGTIKIERYNGISGNYELIATVEAASQDYSSETYPVKLEIGKYLNTGTNNQIRISASFDYVTSQGTEGTAVSTYIMLNVQSVSLQLTCSAQWESIIYGNSRNDFPLSYNILGAVEKTLYISISGDGDGLVRYPIVYSANDQGTKEIHVPNTQQLNLLSHGVHTVRAWLEASNGNGGIIKSPIVVNQFMVVNPLTDGVDLMAPRIMIQNLLVELQQGDEPKTVENFVQSTILGYAVYSPTEGDGGVIINDGDPLNITFKLTNSNQSIITVQQTDYAMVPVVAQPNTQYSLGVTVEIEQAAGEEVADSFNSFLHIIRTANNVDYDFMLESLGIGYALVSVDNTCGFQPISGSTFLINPKTRSNTESNPKRILNARQNNSVVESTWTGFHLGNEDGWITDGTPQNNKVLRVPAGRTLNIQFNPFSQFRTQRSSSMTLDIDFAVRNVTNEDNPIIQICEQVEGLWRGLRMSPMVGTMTTESKTAAGETDFRWQEDERTHVSINIVSAVTPNINNDGLHNGSRPGNPNGSMPLVRVFINGVINRELQFSVNSFDEFCTGAMSNGGITIGQSGADIDIYGIRCWQEKAIDSAGCVQNWLSTLSSSEEKKKVKALNNIIDPSTNQINIDYIKGTDRITGIHKNILIWHGNEPYHDDTHKNETGWLEIWRYDDNGNYLPEYSGTICKATKSIPQKRQGTTANTYYYSNIQFKIDKIADTITISPSDLHESIDAEWDAEYEWLDGNDMPTGEVGRWKIKGGYLGKNFPLPTETTKNYHGTADTIIVPDGWIDGNGKYRGMGYRVAEGIPMAQKMVNKINYASSMQSHLIGINWLYNELHTSVVGKNALQDAVSGAVVAKHTEPFLFFTQAETEGSNAVFRGPCAFGAGKMDKPSWGYVKSQYANFTMIEGADNDKALTDMRVPFDDEPHGNQPAKVFYNPDEEGFCYRLPDDTPSKPSFETCIDFDTGATYEVEEDGNVKEYPKEEIVYYIRRAWNFLYLHAPRIRYYDGSYSDFLNSSDATKTQNKYWCRSASGTTSGDYLLKRYDFYEQQWVDAGLWDSENQRYEEIDLRTYSMTKTTWDNMTASEKAALDVCNQKFIEAIVADCKANIGNYFKVESLRFHYAFENHLMAGTDNCSKNTYYVLVPVVRNNETVWLFELHQDDVDTTLATDNSGLQSKPYYIDRMHPYGGTIANASRVAMTSEVTSDILYEGYYNVLFDLTELMYENTRELQSTMRAIFGAMASLNGGIHTEETESLIGVWKTLARYLFNIQRYFPQTVFNEAARIRYEFPTLIGYKSDNRDVVPITQSLGDQLQSELQFMKRRLVYMASYAAFGEFRNMTDRPAYVGVPDAMDAFSMMHKAIPGGSSPSVYNFDLVPHQWLYPVGGVDNDTRDNHNRVAPDPSNPYRLSITPSNASDNGISVYGLNFYRSLGNVGDMVTNEASEFVLNGKRLTDFTAEPTKYYSLTSAGEYITADAYAGLTDEQKQGYKPCFRVSGFSIGSATRLESISLKGSVLGGGNINLGDLSLTQSIDLRQTDITRCVLPVTTTLETLKLPAGITTLTLNGQTALSTLTMEGYKNIQSLYIGDGVFSEGSKVLVRNIYETEDNSLTSLSVYGVDWDNVYAAMLTWITSLQTYNITGAVRLINSENLPLTTVLTLIDKYGNIQSEENILYVYYKKSGITTFVVRGDKHIKTTGEWRGWSIEVRPSYGNNVAIVDGHADIHWELQGTGVSEYAEVTDDVNGVINVIRTDVTENPIIFNLHVEMGLLDEEEPLEYNKSVSFSNRIPKVGDFAYADGTFDNEWDDSKYLVGTVFKRDIIEWYDSLETIPSKCKLWVWAKENANIKSTDQVLNNTALLAWGVYNQSAETDGFATATLQSMFEDTGIAYSSVVDIPSPATNLTSSGVPNADGTSTDYRYIRNSYLDATQDDGYAILSSGCCNVYNAEERNKAVLDIANAIIDQYMVTKISVLDGRPTTSTQLANAMRALATWASSQGASAVSRYYQLFFPATYACKVYSPKKTAASGAEEIPQDELNVQYRRGKWMLPTMGQLARIYNFYYNSCNRVTYENGGRNNKSYANENPDSEALTPLFANLLKRFDNAGVSSPGSYFVFPTNSYYWSVVETYSTIAWSLYFNSGSIGIDFSKYFTGYVARGVAAFNFEL